MVNVRRSAPFSFANLGRTYVKLTKITDAAEILARIEVAMEGSTIFIVVNQEDKMWPYRVDNFSGADVIIFQAVRKSWVIWAQLVECARKIQDSAWRVHAIHLG